MLNTLGLPGMVFSSSYSVGQCASASNSCKYIPIFIMHFWCLAVTSLLASVPCPCNKVVYFLISFVIRTWIHFMLLLCLDYLAFFLTKFAFFYMDHLFSGTLCSAAAGIHSLAFLVMPGLFPGTRKKLHQYVMPLLISASFHMPICNMHELL